MQECHPDAVKLKQKIWVVSHGKLENGLSKSIVAPRDHQTSGLLETYRNANNYARDCKRDAPRWVPGPQNPSHA